MSAVLRIIKSRQRRSLRSRSRFTQQISQFALGIGIITSLLISLCIIALTFTISSLSQYLPSLETLPILLDSRDGKLHEPTRLFDRSGEHIIAILENLSARDKKYLSIGEDQPDHIPPSLVQATITASDPEFWIHQGFYWDVFQLENHPTLAQRLIAENILWDEQPSIQRAFTERVLAAQITSQYGRNKILEWYINSAKYGDFVYGADAAARAYFDKSAANLSLAEAAILAAAAQSPNLNLLDSPQAAINAKDLILKEMYKLEMISSQEYDQAVNEKITFQQTEDLIFDISPVFTKLVLDQVGELFPLERIMRGGLNIITTLEFDLHSQAECTLTAQLNRITDLPQDEGTSEKCDMARLLPSQQTQGIPTGSSVAASIVVLDPRSGQILSIVDSDEAGIDPTQPSGHPPGSILTPFIYLTSFAQGMSPGTMVWDTSAALPEGFTDVQNPDGKFHGPVRLRTALVNDYFVPTIQILSQLDPNQVWHTAQQLGLRNLEIPTGEGAYLLPLEGGQASLLELSQAYGVFASQGILAGITQDVDLPENGNTPIDPQVVLKVLENSGEEWLDCTNQLTECQTVKRPVISPQLAYLITNTLSDETARWPSLGHPNQLEIGRPVSAKIGSTVTGEDTWTIGYTPNLVAAVWMGLEVPDEEIRNTANLSAGLWHALIQYASRDQPVEEFTTPPGITTMKVCDPSGLLPTDECPHLVDEIFTHGNEPTQVDNLYQTFLINRETDRLATIFTSPELVEEKVFMVVPPEAETWAREANIPTIPQAYDVLDPGTTQSSDVRVSSPEMFNVIKGSIPIMGRATGEGFNYYRLQMGSGLNPETWLQIGEDVDHPVQNGPLEIWDTSGLSGLYALQLVVVYEDDRVESTIVQLTVDNQPPQALIRYPVEGQKFSKDEYDEITLQAEVSDNLELDYVEFFLDGEPLVALSTPPFVVPWRVTPGEHNFLVRALDRAGNSSKASVDFIIGK
jgi:membrane peptidoglycan carboxypeptidase